MQRFKRDGISDSTLARAWNVERSHGARAAQGTGRDGGVQSRGHLRGGVRKLHAVSVFELRIGMRSRALQPQEGHDPGQRAQPHRAGNRVRLLLLPRVLRAAGVRYRVDHGQLQPGDRLDRLRHQRPAVLRAADARRSPEHLRHREARRRDRAVRRADSADAGAAAEGRRRADHRHRPREYRPGRGSQTLRQAAGRFADSRARERLGHQRAGGLRRGARRSAIRCWCGRATCWAGAPW